MTALKAVRTAFGAHCMLDLQSISKMGYVEHSFLLEGATWLAGRQRTDSPQKQLLLCHSASLMLQAQGEPTPWSEPIRHQDSTPRGMHIHPRQKMRDISVFSINLSFNINADRKAGKTL